MYIHLIPYNANIKIFCIAVAFHLILDNAFIVSGELKSLQ